MATSPSRDDRRAALEELRTADRIVAGVLGSMRTSQRDQILDVFGGPDTSEGFFGEHAAADAGAAQLQLNEAEIHMRRAAERMGLAPDADEREGLKAPGVLEAVFDGLFDLLAVARSMHNVDSTQKLHARVRALFEQLHAEDPDLDIEPLAEWEDSVFEGAVEELKAAAKFRRPQLILIGLATVAGLVFTIWMLSTVREMMGEAEALARPVVEALAADDRARFDALTSLGPRQDEAFAELRERLGERGAVAMVRCSSASRANDRTSASCVAHFEEGGPLGVSMSARGETVVSFELRPPPEPEPDSWLERIF